jgi:hypothetical protein
MAGTRRVAIAERTISAADQRESGRPDSRGNVQARAVIWALTVEGKKARRPRPLRFGQRSGGPPPLAPFLNRAHCCPQLPGNLGVVPVRVCVGGEDDLGPQDTTVAGRFAETHKVPQVLEFFKGERNRLRWLGSSGHGRSSALRHRWTQCNGSRFLMSKPYANL